MRRMKSTQLNWRGGDLEAMQLTEYCLQITLAHAFPKSNMHWVFQRGGGGVVMGSWGEERGCKEV